MCESNIIAKNYTVFRMSSVWCAHLKTAESQYYKTTWFAWKT